MRPSFLLHIHPPSIPARQARFRYTLAAGGLAVFLIVVLLVTGILETFYYVPTPDQAGTSIQTITFLVPYGFLVRNLHFWAAQMLLVVSIVHVLRVIFTGAYGPPRNVNYLIGLGLFIFAVLLDFTGYILRWDEGIHWALIAGTKLINSVPLIGTTVYTILLGGGQPGPATLLRFYGWHIFGLSIVAGVFLIWHIFRVRRDGGIALPPPSFRQDHIRISRFELFRRELLAMVLSATALLILATIAPAPLAQPISASSSLIGDVRAPWFFLWVQQLLKLGSPFLWGVVVPLAILLLLSLLPFVFPLPRKSELGRWFPNGNRIAQVSTVIILLTIIILTILALLPVPG